MGWKYKSLTNKNKYFELFIINEPARGLAFLVLSLETRHLMILCTNQYCILVEQNLFSFISVLLLYDHFLYISPLYLRVNIITIPITKLFSQSRPNDVIIREL